MDTLSPVAGIILLMLGIGLVVVVTLMVLKAVEQRREEPRKQIPYIIYVRPPYHDPRISNIRMPGWIFVVNYAGVTWEIVGEPGDWFCFGKREQGTYVAPLGPIPDAVITHLDRYVHHGSKETDT